MSRRNRAHLLSIMERTIELALQAQKEKKSKQLSLYEIIDEESGLEEPKTIHFSDGFNTIKQQIEEEEA